MLAEHEEGRVEGKPEIDGLRWVSRCWGRCCEGDQRLLEAPTASR